MTYLDVNDLSLGYVEHAPGGDGSEGDAPPLILLHGGLCTGDMFEPILPALTEHRRVVTADLQAHGRTADIADRPLRFESMADDIAALIKGLGLEQADVMGYSLGGGVALRTAIQHPQLVRRLVLVSTPCHHEAWFPEVRTAMRRNTDPAMAELMKQSPLYESYARVAPRPEDWPSLVAKTSELVSGEYDWRADVDAITAPTLLAFADADSIRTAHMAEFYGLLGGGQRDAGWEGSGLPPRSPSQLAVLPGRTHYDVIMAPALLDAAVAFLG
jgi:pimeloyl-ACP methyl ester carboxylesterase